MNLGLALTKRPLPRATVYTQVECELVAIRERWHQTAASRGRAWQFRADAESHSLTNRPSVRCTTLPKLELQPDRDFAAYGCVHSAWVQAVQDSAAALQ